MFNLSLVSWRLARRVLSLKSKENYLGKIFKRLQACPEFKACENEEYNGLLKIHHEVKSLSLSDATEIDFSYISQHCPEIEELDVSMKGGNVMKLQSGFQNLVVVKLDFCYYQSELSKLKRLEIVSSSLQHVTALPNLKVLEVKHAGFNEFDDHAWSKMERLQSLEIDAYSWKLSDKLARCCPATLTNLYLELLNDDQMITCVLQSLPNLKSVGFNCPWVSEKVWSSFIGQFGKQIQYWYLENCSGFTSSNLDQLTAEASDELVMFESDKKIESDVLSRFVKQYGSQLRRFKICERLPWRTYDENDGDEDMLRMIVDHCPHLVSQGEWNLEQWGCLSYDAFYYFLDKAGHSLQTFTPTLRDDYMAKGYLEEIAIKCPNIHSICLPETLFEQEVAMERLVRNLNRMVNLRKIMVTDYSPCQSNYNKLMQSLPHLQFCDWTSDCFISYTDPARKKYLG